MGNNVNASMTFFFKDMDMAETFYMKISANKKACEEVYQRELKLCKEEQRQWNYGAFTQILLREGLGILTTFKAFPSMGPHPQYAWNHYYGTTESFLHKETGMHLINPSCKLSHKEMSVNIRMTFQWYFPEQWIRSLLEEYDCKKCEINLSGEDTGLSAKRLEIVTGDPNLYRRRNAVSVKRLLKRMK